jgi:hypothetical protein
MPEFHLSESPAPPRQIIDAEPRHGSPALLLVLEYSALFKRRL